MTSTTTAAGTGAARDETIRTYGGWRRSRGIGIGGLTAVQSLVVLVALVVPILAASFQWKLALVLAVPAAVAIGVTVARRDGLFLTEVLAARVGWHRARQAGETEFRAVTEHPRGWQLPGLLAATRLLSVNDPGRGPYALVWNRRTGLLTGTINVAATGSLLAERADVDAWVANWGGLQADLGTRPAVVWLAVTVATTPEPGHTMRSYVASRIVPTAPVNARKVMEELVADVAANQVARVETTVSVTIDPSRTVMRPSTLPDAAAEAGVVLTDIENTLAGCGVTILGRATAAETAARVRAAFSPASAVDLVGRDKTVDWAEAGPVAATEEWDRYRHDDGVSVTWGLRELPRQQVTSDVLARLLAPGNWPRRVTLFYRAYSAATAAGVVERETNAAHFRERVRQMKKRDATARDVEDADRARRSAAEEAVGAGVGLHTLYVTTTVTDPKDLRAAVADVEEQRAGQAKLRLRRLYGGQAAGFVATLPAGVYPPYAAARIGRR